MSTDKTRNRDAVIREDLSFWQTLTKNVHESGPFFMVAIGVLILVAPQIFELGLIAFAIVSYLHRGIPFPELPSHYGPSQKSSTPLYCMGLEMSVKQPVWFSDTQMRQHMLVMGTTGAGKAQPLDALVQTPNGWCRMGDLHIGDLVNCPDGTFAEVLGIYPQGILKIYRITLSNSKNTRACGQHLWSVKYENTIENIRTLDIIEKLKKGVDVKIQSSNDGVKYEWTSIESIIAVGESDAQCIYIDHPDHLYVTDDYIVTHNTELLLFLSAQAMAMGSGVIFVDGKGDVKTWFRLYSIAKRLGVEENLRVLNFGTNRKAGEIKYDLSNTLNPFTLGDAGQLAEMMSALMAEAGGDGGMWKGRAESMMRALLTALVDLREIGVLALGPNALADNMPLDKFGALENDPRISDLGRLEIKRYLDSLPGFRAGGQGKAEADKQHGFLTMQFTEILGLFNNAYGHIMAFKYGEVDMFDIIVNRRSLYVMLPSMEKSGNSVKNLGKIVVNQIRAALSKTLGAGIKGSRAEKLEARPTNSTTPMLCILDEYGSYAVEGFGEVAAQARSIGFSTVFAVQDWASLEKADSKGNEAQRIWANTNIKVIMKVEDSKSTMPLVIDRIKEGYVLADQGKEVNDDSVMGGLKHQKNVGYKEVKRLDPLKLFKLKNGRMYVIYEDRFHEVQATYLPDDKGGWANVDYVTPNRLLPLAPPNMEQVASEIAMSRNWVFTGDFNKTDEILDSPIPEESAFFKAALTSMNEYPDDDPARQGLEFVRVFMRTALQFAAKEAHKLFMGSSGGSSSGDSDDNPYQRKAQGQGTSNIPWSAPVAEPVVDPSSEYDDVIDDDEYDEGHEPYVIEDFSESEEDIETYPENLNKVMPVLNSKEYVGGALELAEDKDDVMTHRILNKWNEDKNGGDDDSDGDDDDDEGHYDD